VQDASAPGLYADLGGYSALPREILVQVSQGVASIAHKVIHPAT
jgi:hypothetical protein